MALKDQLTSLIPLIAQDVKGKGGSSVLMQGNGRPDQPETTDGKITGNEPNGTLYNSTNGGGSGAYLWHKQAGKWTVIYGDTGYKRQSQAVNIKQGYVALRRVNNTVECHFPVGHGVGFHFTGVRTQNSAARVTLNGWIF